MQFQTDVPLWMVGSNGTVLSIASGEKEVYGFRGRWLKRLFGVLGISAVARYALQAVATVVVTAWWFKCLSVRANPSPARTLFIGFGGGVERHMAPNLSTEIGEAVDHLNQSEPRSLARVARPNLWRLWKHSAHEARVAIDALRLARHPLIREHAQQWLVASSVRMSGYVFAKAWNEAIPASVERMVFITSNVDAFAALEVDPSRRRRIELRQHGLHKMSIVFPLFPEVLAINPLEAAHIASRLPNARVRVADSRRRMVRADGGTVLIVSTYDTPDFRKEEHSSTIQAICNWAGANDLRVTIRLHPTESSDFWRHAFPDLRIDQSRSFEESLESVCPRFVFGWGSTALVEALEASVIPVLIRSGSDWLTRDLVFPFWQATVSWESGDALLTSIVKNDESYQSLLRTLQQAAHLINS